MSELVHPVDGSPCASVFRNFPGCPTCIERAHKTGNHEQCVDCGWRRPPGFDYFSAEARYEVKILDQDNRVVYWDFSYILLHSRSPRDAAARVASDARFWFETDGTVLVFEVFATDKETGAAARCGYQREWQNLYGCYSPGPIDAPRLFELDYSYFRGEEGYRYFRDPTNANAACLALFDPNRRLRRNRVLEIPFDPTVETED